MSTPVISVKGLGKRYRLGATLGHDTLRDHLAYAFHSVFRQTAHSPSPDAAGPAPITDHRSPITDPQDFWALRDVSFDVQQGEVVGVIGRNGAGKSTLLKILTQITEPTEGEVRIRGRVASLLEVGTGFHPELSGRENIYLNGAILGMSRAEIRRKFDEIVDFSGVEKFLDTPVKRYSSGMYVRLAFAVAAHLEPEILLVDEVLAVGDAEFQKKCLGKMGEVAKGGRTVLFVSHNMNAVQALCQRAILLHEGLLKQDSGDVTAAVRQYLSVGSAAVAARWVNPGGAHANPWFQPLEFHLGDRQGRPLDMPVRSDAETWVYLTAKVEEMDPALTIGYALYTEDGTCLYWSYHTDTAESEWPKLGPGRMALRSQLLPRLLNEGSYRLELLGGLHHRKWLFQPGRDAPAVVLTIQGGLSDSPLWLQKRPGVLAPNMKWERHVV